MCCHNVVSIGPFFQIHVTSIVGMHIEKHNVSYFVKNDTLSKKFKQRVTPNGKAQESV